MLEKVATEIDLRENAITKFFVDRGYGYSILFYLFKRKKKKNKLKYTQVAV